MGKKYNSERGSELLKFFDRYLGIPLTCVVGLMRRKRECPSDIQKIALLNTAAIGDTILIAPIIKDLKSNFPDSNIIFFTGSSNYEIAKLISEKIDIRVVKLPIKNPIQAINLIKRDEFDLWCDFGQWPRLNAIFSAAAKAHFKIGFKTPGQFRHYGYDAVALHSRNVHELDNYRNLIRQIGIDSHSFPKISVDKIIPEKLLAQGLRKPYVVLHMFPGGSRSYMKEWPVDRWISIAKGFVSRGWHVVFTGALSQSIRVQNLLKELNNTGQVFNSAGLLSMSEVASLLAASALVVSVNTGIMHLAAAVGARLIALHGPTSPLRWGPISSKAIVLSPENCPCAPCLHLGFEYQCNENKCMQSISVQMVQQAIEKALSHYTE